MNWWRAIVAWLVIVMAETIHGTLRQLFLVPRLCDLRARQLGYSRERMLEDYDLAAGGYMGFGLLFLLCAPYLAARARGFGTRA